VELVHCKLGRGENAAKVAVYQLQLVFGSPIRDSEGKSISSDGQTVNMAFMNGMPPEDFVVGLRNLANHIEDNYINAKEAEGG
jgi:hypothetical protein